ncbi:glycosyltransferase [Rhodococcus ruber]|uniref:glycosyltransferase n=1 Tax=Rhodococcus ruber TaxID=1830 RepID=UPI00193467ED|nr:glycosyltransferase [Rhodococcus ruber]
MNELDRVNVSIAHDYLLQCGGAERVVEVWARQFPKARISTLAYNPEATFPTFSNRIIHTALPNKSIFRNIEPLLPVLPSLSRRTRIQNADLAIISTSGFAHLFDRDCPAIVYFHSPARWLYAANHYRMGLSIPKRIGLALATPILKALDKIDVGPATSFVANSRVTQDRLRNAYGIDAPVVNPPVNAIAAQYEDLPAVVPSEYILTVARPRGYKNVDLASNCARILGIPLVVAGSGSEGYSDGKWTYGVGRVNDGVLRSLYRNARALILTGFEDFGLTAAEANYEGTPIIATPVGGYLETVTPGVNGYLAEDESVGALVSCGKSVLETSWHELDHFASERFSNATHFRELGRLAQEVMAHG